MRNFNIKNSLYTATKYISTVISTISTTLVYYFADNTIKTSQLGYLALQSIFGIILYSPMILCQNKFRIVKSIDKKELLKILTFIEIPSIIGEFCVLKSYENAIALPTAINSFYPILNLVKDHFVPIVSCNILNNTIIVDKTRKFFYKEIAKDIICVSLYTGSTILIYLDEAQNNTDDNTKIINSAFYAVAATTMIAIYANFTNKYSSKFTPDVLTYTSILSGIPVRIFAAGIGYAIIKSTSPHQDFVDNNSDLGIVVGLSGLNIFATLTIIYAFTDIKHVSDCALLSVITANTFSILLSKNFNISHFTAYSSSGLVLSIISSVGIIINNRIKDKLVSKNSDIIDLIFEELRLDGQKDQLKKDILHEKDANKIFYNIINTEESTISTQFSEVLLVVISKMLQTNIYVNNKYDRLSFVICYYNNDSEIESISEKKINIQIKFNKKSTLDGKLISIYQDRIEVMTLELDDHSPSSLSPEYNSSTDLILPQIENFNDIRVIELPNESEKIELAGLDKYNFDLEI